MDLSAEFATLIQAAADGTLPRPAIEDALTSALAAPALVVLRGEPGSGEERAEDVERSQRDRQSLARHAGPMGEGSAAAG